MPNYSFMRAQIEQIVILEKLNLDNRCLPCSSRALLRQLDQKGIHPLPSLSAIRRILYRHALTHQLPHVEETS